MKMPMIEHTSLLQLAHLLSLIKSLVYNFKTSKSIQVYNTQLYSNSYKNTRPQNNVLQHKKQITLRISI